MNIAAIQFPVFNPYKKSTVEIYISGCNKKCSGCHNPELQNFNYGKLLNTEEIIKYLKEREDLFEIVSITGGDLCAQEPSEAQLFIAKLTQLFPNKSFWLFTGNNSLEECPYWVTQYFSTIKIGVYNEKEKQEGFPASKNQRVLQRGIDY